MGYSQFHARCIKSVINVISGDILPIYSHDKVSPLQSSLLGGTILDHIADNQEIDSCLIRDSTSLELIAICQS